VDADLKPAKSDLLFPQETGLTAPIPASQLTKQQRLNVSSAYYGAWLAMLFAVFLGSRGIAFCMVLPWIAIAMARVFQAISSCFETEATIRVCRSC
jgi:hypothetical protein